ncbi:hypothetical protein Tco_0099542 [Tanacetum coccineum]
MLRRSDDSSTSGLHHSSGCYKGNDLKPYVRRFQELAVLCPNMVPNTEKLLKAFIEGLPRSIEGNVTSSKLQTLEEAITITQRLIDQVTEHLMARSGIDLKMVKLLVSAAIFIKLEVLQIGISAMVIENKVKTLTITTFLLLAKKVLRATAFPK